MPKQSVYVPPLSSNLFKRKRRSTQEQEQSLVEGIESQSRTSGPRFISPSHNPILARGRRVTETVECTGLVNLEDYDGDPGWDDLGELDGY